MMLKLRKIKPRQTPEEDAQKKREYRPMTPEQRKKAWESRRAKYGAAGMSLKKNKLAPRGPEFISTYNGKVVTWPYDRTDYPRLTVNGKLKLLHVYVWEQTNGPKPPKYDIHHIDHNKWNFSLENLQLVTRSEHERIHAGWLKENGVWSKKPCVDCLQVFPLSEFYPRPNGDPVPKCKKCSCAAVKKYTQENYEKVREKWNIYNRTRRIKK